MRRRKTSGTKTCEANRMKIKITVDKLTPLTIIENMTFQDELKALREKRGAAIRL